MPLRYSKLMGEVTIDSTNNQLQIDGRPGSPIAVTLVSGRYADVRVLGNDAGAGDIASIMTAADANAYTVTVSDTTGLVTIAGAANFGITWTDTSLRDLLGFTVAVAGSNSYTGVVPHQRGFYPVRPLWWRDLDSLSDVEEAFTVSRSGFATVDHFYEHLLGRLEYQFVVATEEAAWLTFWEDVVRRGLTFNFYRDRTVNTKFNRVSVPQGYDRWLRHEGVHSRGLSYPYRPFTVIRRVDMDLRQDTEDTAFTATGT